MSIETFFSRHAFLRANQRLSIDVDELAAILDNGAFVDIGSEPCTSRSHRLFYSAPDRTCFVAIQDSMTGTVVTVLPLEYHKNLAWEVSEADQSIAKKLMESFRSKHVFQKLEASTISISVSYIESAETMVRKTKKLFGISVSDFPSIRDVLSMPNLIEKIEAVAAEKGIGKGMILGAMLRKGSNQAVSPVCLEMWG